MAGYQYGSPSKKALVPAFHRSSAERCKFEWTIVNFHGFFQDGGGPLNSNAFTASCSKFTSSSLWRLKIKPSCLVKEAEHVVFSLERCSTDAKSHYTVTAHARLGICCRSGEICFKKSYINRFVEGNIHDFEPEIVRKNLLENMNHVMPDDTLTVHCELDVYSEECRAFFEDIHRKSPPELKELSDTMKDFAYAARNTDLILKIRDVQIRCHKAILSTRSQVFASLIDNCTRDLIELRDISSDVVGMLLAYVYTGNLSLLFPRNSYLLSQLFEAAKTFQLSELESFLEPDVIHCRSIIPVYRYKFDWKIANFSKCRGCSPVEFDGPTTKWFAVGEAEWQVSLAIMSNPGSGVAPLRVNLRRSAKTQIYHRVFFEVALLDIKSEFRGYKQTELLFSHDGQSGINIMSREEILNEKFLLFEDTLTLSISFAVSSPIVESTTEMSEFNLVCDLVDGEDSDLQRLSRDFQKLFQLDKFKGMTIDASDGKFKVHECIIDARCPCLKTNENFKNRLAEMPSNTVESFLKFLYTGDRKCLCDHALQFYFLAKDLNMEVLKKQYFNRLKWILSIKNVLDIIQEAHRVNDGSLKVLALNFIKKIADKILNTEEFQDLKSGNPALAEEIIAFAG